MADIRSGPIEVDIAAREAQVVGSGPRIGPIAQEDMDEEAIALCVAVREGAGVFEHSRIPDYMRTMIKHPAIYAPHMAMGSAIFNGTIPPRERELAVLRVGWLCRAPYEWGQHVNIAHRIAMPAQDIARVQQGSSAPGWSEHEAAILRGVEELIGDQSICDETWEVLARSWNEAQLIEFPMMVGQYVATAYVQNALRMPLEGGNPGLANR